MIAAFFAFIIRSLVKIIYKPKLIFTNPEVQKNKVDSPCVIIANHTTTMDPIVLMSIIKGKKTIVVAKDWYEKKQFHWLLKMQKCIPCDRFNMDTEWILEAKRSIAEGKSIIIFPEGKCRTDGELNEFKSGFAFLARSYKIPVLSLGIDGIYKFTHRTRVVFGTPEAVERAKGIPSSQDLEQKSEYFRGKVIELKKIALEDCK